MKTLCFTGAILFSMGLSAQLNCVSLNPDAANRIQKDINYLASDELEGRKPGTEGAEKAATYIEEVFTRHGLAPLNEIGSFRQSFDVAENVAVGNSTFLVVDDAVQRLKFDFFPTRYSANAETAGSTIYVQFGIVAPELKRDDYKRKKIEKNGIVVLDIGSPDGVHPHSEYLKYHDLGERIALAKEKGAKAVLLVNIEGQASDLSPEYKNIRSSEIPVVFIQNTTLAKQLAKGAKVELLVEQKEQSVKAFNVLGYLNNNAPNTVIIGAHYDHLGYGGPNSLYAQKDEPEIHNGADDNASGTAGLLELVRYLSAHASKFSSHNFLFMAFSAEEEGLLGSAFFAKHTSMDMAAVSYMLNMDMIGRMEDSVLAVNGVGTSPFWKGLVKDACGVKVKTSESGTGPSDHTSFYNRDIPVLHFFTGTHQDYHKPSDDAEKINAEGEAMVLAYMLGIIQAAEATPDLAFTKTKAENSADAPRFSVTLGVMPDYLFEGVGMRIDGVTEERPAAKAGLQAGDVVLHMGDVKVVDMMSYMKGLGQFKKGDKTTVTYSREGKEYTVEVEF
jgi:hypothetical protein